MSELPEASPARETITDIETAARRAADLARQMLAYSGRGQFIVQQFDLSSLVREMDNLLRAYTHRAVMHYSLAPDLPPVEADGTQIRQVIMNLVINAADAIGDADGAISVRTGRMYADADYLASTYLPEDHCPGEYVYLEVSDSGEGMPPDTLARIFDPFFTTKFTGKGLGLAAVLGIVRGHQGAIKVDSAPGEGTTFRLLLPAASTRAPAAVEEARPVAWRGSGTVLLADDEEPVRKVAARALRSFGFEVIEADNGMDALEVFDGCAEPVVAALVDVTMPRMNGEQLFDALRERNAQLPVVFMSGYSEDGHARGAHEDCVTFVQKPFDLATLRGALQRVLDAGFE
ncbi:MAG: ATP-binding protein [Dehalococcoidia bacterium]|nr:ATP-binding protein [Dehalococcoidia bacterium]